MIHTEKKLILLFFPILLLGILFQSEAQISVGGRPYSFQDYRISDDILFMQMPVLDNQILLNEENENVEKSEGFVFGKEFDVDFNLFNSGVWTPLSNGDRIWRLGISSPDAYSINLIFNRFYLPETSNLFIYTKDKKYVIGAFTSKNNLPDKLFPTTLLPGDEIIIEYYEPKEVKGQGEIHLSTVVHGYKDFFFKGGVYGSSGSCHININCVEGAPYQTIKRSVALILNGSYALCTGTLINNTANDEKPYFLTAQHCLKNKTPSTFVFVFGYESQNCDGTNGKTGFSVSGCTLIADGDKSDFALLQLSAIPPIAFNPYYAGWNRINTPANSALCIHHPSGDYKKISICNSTLESSNYDEYTSDTHWKVTSWNKGSTEGGSSGAPLFNSNKLVIGQLEGGTASCNELDGYDLFGKFSYSWTNDNNSESYKRLKDWLDPLNTGVTTLSGYDPCIAKHQFDVAVNALIYPNGNLCQNYIHPVIRIENLGSDTLTQLRIYLQMNNSVSYFDWTGVLPFTSTQEITLPAMNVADGNYTLTIWSSNPNQHADENRINDTVSSNFNYQKGISCIINIKTDIYPEQTTWVLKDINGNIIAQNPSNLAILTSYNDTICLDTGCYDFVIYDTNGLNGSEGVGAGYFYIYLNSKTILSGIEFEYSDSIRFCIDTTTSIVEHNSVNGDFKVSMYPNPTNAMLTVSLKNIPQDEVIKATVYALDGKKLMESTMIHDGQQFDFSSFQNGIYIVKIQGKKINAVQKIIIQK